MAYSRKLRQLAMWITQEFEEIRARRVGPNALLQIVQEVVPNGLFLRIVKVWLDEQPELAEEIKCVLCFWKDDGVGPGI